MNLTIILSWLGMFLCLSGLRADEPKYRALFAEDFSRGLNEAWKPVKFTGLTEYKIIREGTNFCLQGHADKTASGLAHELKLKSSSHLKVQWRWKIDRCPPGGSENKKDTFDHTVRLFIAFDTFLGPPRTVNYVWANQSAVGETFHHPSSNRARFIVLQQGNEKAGKWLTETRDLSADWQRLFDKSTMPDIVGIGFMTDADGTVAEVNGFYGDIRIFEE